MADFLIEDLTDVGGALADTHLMEVQAPGATPTKKSALSRIKTYLGWVKNNLAATAAPTATDDSAAGYAVGSIWFRTDTGASWRLRDATASAAKWVSMGSPDDPGYVANNWYHVQVGLVLGSGTAVSANSMRFHPVTFWERCTLAAVGARCITGVASGNCQFALYAANSTTKRPTGTAIASTANVDTSAAALVNGTMTPTVDPGMYWLAINCDNSTNTFQTTTNVWLGAMIGSANHSGINTGNTSSALNLSLAQTFGTWPDVSASTFVESTSAGWALMQFKVGSIP